MIVKPYVTRGFLGGEFTDAYGTRCSIQESSLASENAIWFGVNSPDLKIMAADAVAIGREDLLGNGPERLNGWVSYKVPETVHATTRMHLTQTQVKELLPLLQYFVKYGELQETSAAPRAIPTGYFSLAEGNQALCSNTIRNKESSMNERDENRKGVHLHQEDTDKNTATSLTASNILKELQSDGYSPTLDEFFNNLVVHVTTAYEIIGEALSEIGEKMYPYLRDNDDDMKEME